MSESAIVSVRGSAISKYHELLEMRIAASPDPQGPCTIAAHPNHVAIKARKRSSIASVLIGLVVTIGGLILGGVILASANVQFTKETFGTLFVSVLVLASLAAKFLAPSFAHTFSYSWQSVRDVKASSSAISFTVVTLGVPQISFTPLASDLDNFDRFVKATLAACGQVAKADSAAKAPPVKRAAPDAARLPRRKPG